MTQISYASTEMTHAERTLQGAELAEQQSTQYSLTLHNESNQGWTFYDPTYQCALIVWL